MLYREKGLPRDGACALNREMKYVPDKNHRIAGGILFAVFLLIAAQVVLFLMYANYTGDTYSGGSAAGIDVADNDSTDVFGGKDDVPADRTTESAPVLFVMGVYEGKVAVYAADGETLFSVFDVYVDTLPVPDRDALRAGIRVGDSAELGALIEDFTS